MPTKKTILLAGLAVLLLGLLLYSFRPQPVAVSLAEVERGPLVVYVEQEGKTRVQERYVVSSPVTAFAPRLELEVGDSVIAGQTLLKLQPVPATLLDARSRAEAEARAEQAKASLRVQEARLRGADATNSLAQEEYQRSQKLFKRGDIARSALDQAQAQADEAEANLRAARFAVVAARQELAAAEAVVRVTAADSEHIAVERIPVISPVSGRVLAIERKSGQVVAAGAPLLTVGDPQSLEIEVDVLSADAVRIRPGMRVVLDDWGGEEPLEGRVKNVEPSGFTKISALGVEEQRVLVIVDITSPREEWETLGDAYRVEARFVLWSSADVLKVPNSALFREGNLWKVFVAEGGTARKRTVRLGRQGELQSQVIEGLTAGEEVVTHPEDTIEDGTRIEHRSV